MSFILKVFSEIAHYALHFDLLQFQYDRCIYKTVSGAINSARFLNCSPARALDTKQFSPTLWQWQHLHLLDAVRQFGLPDVFMTISPFELSFPFPDWLEQLCSETGLGPTQLAAFETYHIAHTLEQIVRGYLCGSNDKRWSNHVFSYNRIAKYANVRTYFYHFEFQNRGTLHTHLLIWLKDIAKTQHQFIRADIPYRYPAEPEMWFFLCSKKVAWSCNGTKRYSVSTTKTFLQDKTLEKYWKRPQKFDKLTLLEWLRHVDNAKVDPKPYKDGSTLVGTKMHSIFNQQYFFQYTILHMCHRNIAQTYHSNHDNIPKQ